MVRRRLHILGRSPMSESQSEQVRIDGMRNIFSGLGTDADSRKHTRYAFNRKLPWGEIAAIYESNGIGRRIVDLPADDMTRNWITVVGDDDDKVAQALESLYAQRRISDALKFARLFGGAIVLMGIEDGGDLEDPVREEAIKGIRSLTTFDRREVTLESTEVIRSLGDPRFGTPEFYNIIPILGGEQTVKVHASRILRFDGNRLAREEYQNNNYWHDSVLQTAFEALRQMDAVFDSGEFIVNDYVQTILKLKGLMSQLQSAEGQRLVKERLNAMDMSRHVSNTIAIDSEDEYAKHTSTTAGLDTLLDRYMMKLSAVTSIPVTLLMGRSPAGENATGEADVRFYYDHIKSAQVNELSEPLETLVRYLFLANGGEPESWSVEFNPLFEMSQKEKAELYKLNAEADATMVNASIADGNEIEKFRFGGAGYDDSNPYYDVPEDEPPPPPEDLMIPGMMGAVPGMPGAPGADPGAGGDDDDGSDDLDL